MKLRYVMLVFLGILIGWLTVPFGNAEDRSYKELLREAITILSHIQANTAATVDNTKAIKDKLGAK